MNRKVFVTGADRGLGLGIVQEFLKNGDTVFAGQFMAAEWDEIGVLREEYPKNLICVPLDVGSDESVKTAYEEVLKHTDYIDILVNNAGISGGAGDIYNMKDLEKGGAAFNVNVMGPLRMTEAFLPMLEKSKREKRLCYVSSESGSISVCHRDDGFIYPMTKSSLNMAVKMLFERLQPKGYSFRLFHPGWVKSYMMGHKSEMGKFEPEESAASAYLLFTKPQRHEDVLRVIDNEGATWPF